MLEKLIEAIAALTAALNANTAALNAGDDAPAAPGEPAKRGRGRPSNAEKAAAAAPAAAPAPVAAPAQAVPATAPVAAPVAPVAAAGPTYKDVADRLIKVAETKGRDAAVSVLNKLQPGCPALPQLKQELWGAAIAEYDALLGVAAAPAAPAASSLI